MEGEKALKSLMLLATSLMTAAVAQQSSAQNDDTPIVVTGIQPAEARARLEACLARRCPTLEDIAASLQYAEALFVAGDYDRAQSVLRRSLGRNRDSAGEHPVAVAGLYRAHARVSQHFGDGENYRRSAYGVVRSLREGLDERDARVLGAQLEAAEMHVGLADPDSAQDLYRSVARTALEIGRPDIAAMANLRWGMLLHALRRPQGLEKVEEVAANSDPRLRIPRFAARLVLARVARERGDLSASDRLIREMAEMGFGVPTLVYQPPIEIADQARPVRTARIGDFSSEPVSTVDISDLEPTESFDYWADVGFWVQSDGRVEDVEVLRSEGPDHWVRPVLTSVRGRIYSPASGTNGAEPSYRVERFSYTSLMERRTNSRLLQRTRQGRIETLDLTPEGGARPVGSSPAESDPAHRL
jgi:tetratricopeptide (TPR) repeat protein